MRWTTKDEVTISKSRCHEGMFLFTYPDGKGFSVSGGHALMYHYHPPKERRNDKTHS